MKFKKLLLLGMMLPLATSCGFNGDISGTYGFQLGKETGTHFGLFLALSNDPYLPAEGDQTVYEDGLKKFNFSVFI